MSFVYSFYLKKIFASLWQISKIKALIIYEDFSYFGFNTSTGNLKKIPGGKN